MSQQDDYLCDGQVMIYKMVSPLAGHTRIQFELPASLWADCVLVVGDFNQGAPLHLQQTDIGSWQAMIDLPQGQQYHFRYFINGEWCTDFRADGLAMIAEQLPVSLIDVV